MLRKSIDLPRSKQKSSKRLLRGIYGGEADDSFGAYLMRYPSAVVTLETALSLHGIVDEWLAPPFCLSFAIGYRPAKDPNVLQIWDANDIRMLGAEKMERGGITFLCHDVERLLLELWRREKHVSKEIMSKAVFWYRGKANSGELNLPRLREYISKMPKGKIYSKRLSREIL